MKTGLRIILLLGLALAPSPRVPAAETLDYEISQYRLALELAADSTDVKTSMELQYRIGQTPKSEGFKFVGQDRVENLTVRDGAGKVLVGRVRPLRETRLEWEFPAVKNSNQTVQVGCTLKNLLIRKGARASLKVPWAGVFRVPVRKAEYKVVFPKDVDPRNIVVAGLKWKKEQQDGRWCVVVEQSPLAVREFNVEYESLKLEDDK